MKDTTVNSEQLPADFRYETPVLVEFNYNAVARGAGESSYNPPGVGDGDNLGDELGD